MTIAPVRRTVRTKATPERAFQVFVSQMGRWWPRGQTVAPNTHDDIIVEPRIGGRWFERDTQGRETQWGKVILWQPPERLVLAWQLDAEHRYDPRLITEVEIRFMSVAGGGTEVTLEHRNLERLGKDADRRTLEIAEGWSLMLAKFRDFLDTGE